MKLAGYLNHLGGLVRLLGWGVLDGLAALPRLGPEAVSDLLGNVFNHGSTVNEGGGIEQTLVDALFDDFPNSGLRYGPDVEFSHLHLNLLYPLDAGCLHIHMDEVVVRYLVYRVCHDCVDY